MRSEQRIAFACWKAASSSEASRRPNNACRSSMNFAPKSAFCNKRKTDTRVRASDMSQIIVQVVRRKVAQSDMPVKNDRAMKRVPARHVAAVVVGNALEFYDFLTYAFFAVYIGRPFFPTNDPATSLLASLGTFGAGFVTRPIGGFVIGRMGDRFGRKPAMILSFSLMGIAITGLALTPSYATIGVIAPALVLVFRMMQGFALGGEVGPTTA